MKPQKVYSITDGKLVEHRGQELSHQKEDTMRITQNGTTWDSIEEYMLYHEQANPLQRTVDGIFSNFTEMVKTGGFEAFGDDVKSQEFVAALNDSNAFKQLVADVLICGDLPEENIRMVATAIGYMVFAGYAIHRAEPLHAALNSLN